MWLWNQRKIRYAVRSYKWSAVRKEHLKKQPCCQCCGSCDKPEVHHIIPVHIDASKELDPDNLITLCDKYCHFVFGHFMHWKSWNVNILQHSKQYINYIKTRP